MKGTNSIVQGKTKHTPT